MKERRQAVRVDGDGWNVDRLLRLPLTAVLIGSIASAHQAHSFRLILACSLSQLRSPSQGRSPSVKDERRTKEGPGESRDQEGLAPTTCNARSCGVGLRSRTPRVPACKAPVRLAFDRLRKPLEAQDERAVKAVEPADADALELGEAALGVGDEAIDVDLHAAKLERLEVGDPPSPQPPGAAGVAAAQVLEADTDLQDALVEVADRVALLEPLELEGLVLLEELAAVELLDAAAEARRGGSPQRPERCPRPGRWSGASLIRPPTLGTRPLAASVLGLDAPRVERRPPRRDRAQGETLRDR